MIVQYGGMLFIFDLFGVVLCCALSVERSIMEFESYQEQYHGAMPLTLHSHGLQAFVSALLHTFLTQQRLAIDHSTGRGNVMPRQ